MVMFIRQSLYVSIQQNELLVMPHTCRKTTVDRMGELNFLKLIISSNKT